MTPVESMDFDEEAQQPAESFETAKPVQVQRETPPTRDVQSTEQYLVGCCLIDEGATLDKAISAGLASTDFSTPSLAATYKALRAMRANDTPIALDTLVEFLGARIEEAGGIHALMALDTGQTTVRADHALRQVLDSSERRRLERIGAQIKEAAARGDDPESIREILDRAKARPELATKTPVRTPFSFSIPPANDRSILLGNRYLNRGDGMVVVSSSGMGKSSMSHQMASDWALAQPFFGIKPNGALRILIVQSEDSDGDIAEVWQSLKHVRKYNEAQIAQLESNIRIISEKSKRGVKFLNWLKSEIAAFAPDLVILNPLQAYIDGDVTDSKDLGFFLREGLNGMNADGAFGWLIVHHTTKPATGKDRAERQWHEVMYDMAGGAEIINWSRGVISLRALPEPGKFKAVLAKRGRRAGVTKEVEAGAGVRHEIVTQFGLQHADGFLPGTNTGIICWEPYDLPAEEKPAHKAGGRPERYPFEKYRSVLPKKTDKGLTQAQIQRACVPNGKIGDGTISGVLARWRDAGDLEAIVPETGPTLYRAAY